MNKLYAIALSACRNNEFGYEVITAVTYCFRESPESAILDGLELIRAEFPTEAGWILHKSVVAEVRQIKSWLVYREYHE